jgi:serine/threonine protein kinase
MFRPFLRQVSQKRRLEHHIIAGILFYFSPEIWQDKPYDAKCDIWSLGCM